LGPPIHTQAFSSKNLSHPGSIIDIASKVFEILKEMVPGLNRIAVLATRTIYGRS